MSDNNYNWHEIDFDKGDEDYEPLRKLDIPEDEEEIKEQMEYVESNLWVKLEQVGKKISFARDLVALYKYMMDSEVSWYRKAIVGAALVYFISPIDAIPDIIPLIGYLDDLGVIAALLKYLGHELQGYYE